MDEKKIKIKDLKINYKHYPLHPAFHERRGKSSLAQGGNLVFLILHGWGGSSDSWIKVCDILKKNYEIYALDFPFFGKSDYLKEVWTVADYTNMVEEFVTTIIRTQNLEPALKINILAHSFGGRVAIKLGAKNPDWINKLFLCDASGIKHPPTMKQKMAGMAARVKNLIIKRQPHPTPPFKGEGIKTSPLPEADRQPSLIMRGFYRIIGANDYYNCKNEIMRETFKNIIAEDLTPYLEKIKIPTEILWGEKDKYTPLYDGKLMNEKIKNSHLHILKGINHGIHLHAPDKVCNIIKKSLS